MKIASIIVEKKEIALHLEKSVDGVIHLMCGPVTLLYIKGAPAKLYCPKSVKFLLIDNGYDISELAFKEDGSLTTF